jgi:hypothetical protein
VRAVEREPSTTTEAIDESVADCADAVAAGVSEGVSWDQAGVKARQSAEASKVRVKTGTAGRLVILGSLVDGCCCGAAAAPTWCEPG